MIDEMIGNYPPRLSVDELRHELAAYVDYRHSRGLTKSAIGTDINKIALFLLWLETGHAGAPDIQPTIPEVAAAFERI